MSNELLEINETLKRMERKIKDESFLYIPHLIDFEKQVEKSRKDREEKRNEELLELQKNQNKILEIQLNLAEKQTKFSRILTLATGVLALTALIQIIVLFSKTDFVLRSGWLGYLDLFLFIFLIFIVGALLVYIYALLKPKKGEIKLRRK